MSQAFRVPGGVALDRARPISFTFDGVAYAGYEGDTLASALLANGVRIVGRSYKYHRPRGIVSAGPEEPNALVGVARGPGRFTPNLRATEVELTDGLVATSQNRWPSLRFDIGAISDLLAPLFGAGFYYKTFMGPNWLGPNWAWKRVYEPVVRRAAGLGTAPTAPDPDRYARYFDHCDVLVVGAGAAGLAAARAAADSGADVVLCDEAAAPGGSLLAETRATIEGRPARDWLAETLQALGAAANVRILTRTQAFGCYAQNFVGLSERLPEPALIADPTLPRERLWQMRAREVVLAAGAIERPLVFADNDRPGILLAESARRYLNLYGVKVGERVVVVTAHDSAYRAALDLASAGVAVALIADLRDEASGPLPQAARAAGIEVAVKASVHAIRGRGRIEAVRLAAHPGGMRTLACDALLMSGGWTPSVHLFSQARGKLAFDAGLEAFRPGPPVARQRSAGACNATFGLQEALAEGDAAGRAAAEAAGRSPPDPRAIPVEGAPPAAGGTLGAPLHVLGDRHARAFVDFQNDVCVKDVELAIQEGYRSIEHVKRYTTTGMATDQGKLSNMNALAIAAAVRRTSIPEVGLTTFRPPYMPVTFGAFAGPARDDLFDPARRTPIHAWAAERGAAFEDVGQWKRAWYFPRRGEGMRAAVAREGRTVRAGVGLFDASTLGKIEVVGRDAALFLERMYANAFKKLEVGRCRYGLMLTETGYLMDDGVIGRLAPDRFHVTTTTGGAARVLAQMEDYLQTEFTDLEVWLTSTTEQWATIAVQGPRARDTIAPFVEGLDLSNAAFPHMSVRDGKACGVPARVMRVSFSGELGYEINVGSAYGLDVWKALFAEAEKHGGCAYGTETMHVLRAEKGYVIVGQETDGTVTLADLGLDWAIGKAKADFVGKRSLRLAEPAREGRKQLVGLLTEDPTVVLEEGAQVTATATPPTGSSALGHITSSYPSATLGRSIALALVAGGRARVGEKLFASTAAGAVAAIVTAPCFFDPDGKRLHG
ncbi:sarcosine oxidase subunit alpha [Roseiarcus fermentans]|uniref:Sarcosine oxidase subunit alpha n=1 Tax=Roseiarcus fermentans TaxID=1473586 RepID=A0A366FGN3_9HYPH|nr:sarcosine oxidase subunit alpha family protein [Roseiarcus fermentans]RBP13767.1 sarcosine oxidase subunit alpha [Roseiarcus fermentans]